MLVTLIFHRRKPYNIYVKFYNIFAWIIFYSVGSKQSSLTSMNFGSSGNCDSFQSDLLDSLHSCESHWEQLLSLPGLPAEYRQLVVNAALVSKKKMGTAVSCATSMYDSNLKCMAHALRLKQEKTSMDAYYRSELKVSIELIFTHF